eukprot:g11975.t1
MWNAFQKVPEDWVLQVAPLLLAFMRRYAAPQVKAPTKDRQAQVSEARKIIADGLANVGVESLRDALESCGAEWTGYVSEWDWQHIARYLLEFTEEFQSRKKRKHHGAVLGTGDAVDLQRDVLCSFEVRLPPEGEGDVLQRRKHLALRHMRLGEEAEVFCISRFAWGPAGCRAADASEKDVPADADARSARRAGEWTEELGNGNDHFKRKNLPLACRCYEKGLEVFSEQPVTAPVSLGASGKAAAAAVTKTLADVASNLSAVYLEQGRNRDASDHAKIAVDSVPKHEKAIYRLAKASFLLGEFEEGHHREVAPSWLFRPSEASLVRSKHASKSKKLGAALLEAAGEGREYIEKPPPEEPPTFLQDRPLLHREILESIMPTRKQLMLLSLLVFISSLIIFLAPSRYRPQAIITSLLVSTLRLGRATRNPRGDAEMPNEEADGAKDHRLDAVRPRRAILLQEQLGDDALHGVWVELDHKNEGELEAELVLERLSMQSRMQKSDGSTTLTELLRPGTESTAPPSTAASNSFDLVRRTPATPGLTGLAPPEAESPKQRLARCSEGRLARAAEEAQENDRPQLGMSAKFGYKTRL